MDAVREESSLETIGSKLANSVNDGPMDTDGRAHRKRQEGIEVESFTQRAGSAIDKRGQVSVEGELSALKEMEVVYVRVVTVLAEEKAVE